MIRCIRYLLVTFSFVTMWSYALFSQAAEITVFAASSMAEAVTEAAETFSQHSSLHTVRYVFASSSTLARQIIAGAPAHVYISANRAWMKAAVDEGAIVAETVTTIATNRLVLIGRPDTVTALPGKLPTIFTPSFPLLELLGDDSNNRLAIGDPAHVPAGQYARQALEHTGFWHFVENRLAPMPDVRAALNLVVRGETSLGIVYASDLNLTPDVQTIATFPVESHRSISYLAGIVESDTVSASQSTLAQSFLSYLSSPEALQMFQRYGFSSILQAPY